MKICHLYHETTDSLQAKGLVNSFENSESIDIKGIQEIENFSIYVIELYRIDKYISEKLKELFKNKIHPLIYFTVSNNYNLMLFQLAFLLKAKTIITSSQDIGKLVLKLRSDFKLHEEEYVKFLFTQTQLQKEYFLFFKCRKLNFASEKLLHDFGCNSLEEVEKKVCSQFNFKELLSQDALISTELFVKNEMPVSFDVKSNSSNNEDEKFLYFEPYIENNSFNDSLSFVLNRISFIEFLKDKLVEESISSKTFSIMAIHVANLKKLQQDTSKLELETFLKNFLIETNQALDEKLIFAQYDSDFYVVMHEDIEEKNLKSTAENFQKKMISFLNELKFNPNIELFIFNTTTLDLNTVLVILDSISTKTISHEDIKKNGIHYITSLNAKMGDDEAIRHLLKNIYVNKTEIKLLNIYKGLCINTSAFIIKYVDDTIHVKFQQLQGMVMKHEKETVLQSSSFSKDIRATVKFVNLEKQLAILEGFSFLNGNANGRRYSRVTCSTRTPVVVTHIGSTLSGEIIDLSITSIAIRVKYSKPVDNLKAKTVMLSFVLPSKSNVDAYVKVSVQAKVSFIFCEVQACKVVCELEKDNSNEAILMEYVYDRQKEIIIEVKKITRNF